MSTEVSLQEVRVKDEDISVEGMLHGISARKSKRK